MGNIISKLCCCCCCETRKQRQEREVQIIYEKIQPIISISDPVISV